MLRKWINAWIPNKLLLPLALALVWNMIAYYGGRLAASGLAHYDLTTTVDVWIPFVPWTVLIYVLAYPFWGISYIMVCRQPEEKAWRFLSADLLAKAVCLICFLLLPTTNVRPEVGDSGFWNLCMRWLYRMDEPNNLFPSIHCMASWFCYIAVRRNPKVPRWCRCGTLVFAVMICISTLTTKQHVLADTLPGVLLAEGSYRLVPRIGLDRAYRRLIGRVTGHIQSEREKKDEEKTAGVL